MKTKKEKQEFSFSFIYERFKINQNSKNLAIIFDPVQNLEESPDAYACFWSILLFEIDNHVALNCSSLLIQFEQFEGGSKAKFRHFEGNSFKVWTGSKIMPPRIQNRKTVSEDIRLIYPKLPDLSLVSVIFEPN